MGASNFRQSGRGMTISEAYNDEVSEAREEYGNDSYNGTISTTRGVKDYTRKFKNSKLSLNEFINKYEDDGEKWGNCIGICLKEPKANKMKVKSTVTHKVTKGAKKWVTNFVVRTRRDDFVGSELTKGKAVKVARAYTEKTQIPTSINIEKSLVGGENLVARIDYKQSKSERIGEYVFFGWVAE